jgi:hypothetical protein
VNLRKDHYRSFHPHECVQSLVPWGVGSRGPVSSVSLASWVRSRLGAAPFLGVVSWGRPEASGIQALESRRRLPALNPAFVPLCASRALGFLLDAQRALEAE